jgi:hypothetical protein
LKISGRNSQFSILYFCRGRVPWSDGSNPLKDNYIAQGNPGADTDKASVSDQPHGQEVGTSQHYLVSLALIAGEDVLNPQLHGCFRKTWIFGDHWFSSGLAGNAAWKTASFLFQ